MDVWPRLHLSEKALRVAGDPFADDLGRDRQIRHTPVYHTVEDGRDHFQNSMGEDVVEADVELRTYLYGGIDALARLPVLQGKDHASGDAQEVRERPELPLAEVNPSIPSTGHQPKGPSQGPEVVDVKSTIIPRDHLIPFQGRMQMPGEGGRKARSVEKPIGGPDRSGKADRGKASGDGVSLDHVASGRIVDVETHESEGRFGNGYQRYEQGDDDA